MCRKSLLALACFCLCLLIGGFEIGSSLADDAPAAGAPKSQEPPTLAVSLPVQRQVTDYANFTGLAAAVRSVKIVPRVTGYLVNAPFTEGAEVKRGDVLFEIDQRPYQAQAEQAQSQVRLMEARLRVAKADNSRAKQIAGTPGAITPSEVDRYQAAEEQAIAELDAAKSQLGARRLNLDFCKITSPIDGRIGRALLTPGNLVKQDETELATVVSLDPMYVYFNMDERTLLQIRRLVNEGRMKPLNSREIAASFGWSDESGFPHRGKIDFVDNEASATTGTVAIRGVIENPKLKDGTRLISPGMFVRVRLPIGPPHEAPKAQK